MNQIGNLLREATTRLARTDPGGSPRLDAEVLLAYSLGQTRTWLYANGDVVPPTQVISRFQRLLDRRGAGEPVSHLTGQREFWSLTLDVTADTLIPRPETELLVERALALDLAADASVLDLGTGSGAIACALASERPSWQLVAVDSSSAALAVARANAARLGLSNVVFRASDWYDGLPTRVRFQLIVSNPPYVAVNDPHLARGDLRFEPVGALVSGVDGLDAIRRIVAGAPARLVEGGWLWLEHGADQADAVARLLSLHGFSDTDCRADLAGLPRISGGRRGELGHDQHP